MWGEDETPAAAKTCDFSVPMMYHPSHDVLDLDEAERWYAKVFGRPSLSLESLISRLPPRPGSGYPPNYSTFTLLGDVLFDTIDPTRYVIGGVQRLRSVASPHLRLISWYLDDMDAGYRELRRHGLRVTDQLDAVVDADRAPTAFGSDMRLFYTLPEDTGLRYSFSPPASVVASDPRSAPGWAMPPMPEGPLGLRFCSHHTILTDRPERGLKLHCDVLGGTIVHEGRNELRGTWSSYVHLAGSIVEFAVPDRGTAAHADWSARAPDDTYHALTWLVADLESAERHLTAHGVRIASRSSDTLVADPESALGIPWGFTVALTPGDPRHA